MSNLESPSFNSTLKEHQEQADVLFEAVNSRDEGAEWRFKWMHPRFRGKPVAAVRAAALNLADAFEHGRQMRRSDRLGRGGA